MRLGRLRDEIDDVTGAKGSLLETGLGDEMVELTASVDRMRDVLLGRIDEAELDRRLMDSAIAGLREGILVVDAGKRLVFMNDAMGRILDVHGHPAEGAPLAQLIWERSVLDAYGEALSGSAEVRRRVDLPGGRQFELTVTAFSGDEGPSSGAIGLFFDVTRLQALEQVRTEFVADISHELRTPITSVRAAAETLQSGMAREPGEAERFLDIVTKNVSRMEAILQDLAALSKIETGAIKLSRSHVDLLGAISEVAASIGPRAASRGIEIKTQVTPGLALWADRRRLDQILLNLLDNAVKFNRKGGSIWISARRGEGVVHLQIEDTGEGIPPDALERVFHRFYRVDRARSKETPGAGLGLAIVKHLVRLHGGTIRAENRETSGTRIVLEMPAAPRPAETPAPAASQETS